MTRREDERPQRDLEIREEERRRGREDMDRGTTRKSPRRSPSELEEEDEEY